MRSIVGLVNKDLEKNGYDQNPQSEGLLENNFFFLYLLLIPIFLFSILLSIQYKEPIF